MRYISPSGNVGKWPAADEYETPMENVWAIRKGYDFGEDEEIPFFVEDSDSSDK